MKREINFSKKARAPILEKIGARPSTKTSFSALVFEVVKKIPKGKILTYKEVARRAGRPLAWRAVGNILNKNNNRRIPCHRVIKSNNEVGGYNKGTKRKISLLKKEGLKIKNKRITEFL